MNVTTSTGSGFWETSPFQVNFMADREVWTLFYEGDYDSIMSEFGGIMVGDLADTGGHATLGKNYQEAIYTGVQIKRKKGGLADAVIQVSLLYKVSIWGLDFVEVSKDVKTWLVETYKEKQKEEEAYPWLTKIARWENYKLNDEWESYQKFKCGDNEYLTGDALTLAKKILKGVNTYSIYLPVVTRTTCRCNLPEFYEIGFKSYPIDFDGFTPIAGVDPHFDDLASEWLKTTERVTTNGDSTFTVLEQWTGCDQVDPDLYPDY